MSVPSSLVLSCITAFCIFSFSHKSFSQENNRKDLIKNHSARKGNQQNQKKLPVILGNGSGIVGLSVNLPEFSPGEDIVVTLTTSYTGFETSLNGTIKLLFPKVLQFVSADKNPALNLQGELQWQVSYSRGANNSFSTTLHLPNVGDSIQVLKLYARLNTAATDSAGIAVPVLPVSIFVVQPEETPKGSTKGIKWLRTRYSSLGGALMTAVDTSSDGKYLFGTGYQDNFGERQDFKQYVGKFTLDGLPVWENFQIMPNTESISFPSLKHTSDGGVVWLSDTSYNNWVEPFITNSPGIVVKKFDANGNLSWRKFIQTTKYNDLHGKNLYVLPNNDILIGIENVAPDGELINNHSDTSVGNVIVIKLSANGDMLWHKAFGGEAADIPYSITATKSGDIIVTGTTNSVTGSISGFTGPYTNPNPTPSNNEYWYNDAFVLKLDGGGNLTWSKTFSLSAKDFLLNLLETDNGYLVQGVSETNDLLRTDSLKNGAALWLLFLDRDGKKLSEIVKPVYPGYEFDYSYPADIEFPIGIQAIHKARDGNYIVGGYTPDIYGSLKSFHGRVDALIAKITGTGKVLWQKQVGGTSNDALLSMIPDRNDNVFFSGFTVSHDDDIYKNNSEYESMLIGKIGITNTISGKVFIDKNGNHIQDGGEPLFNEGSITTCKANDTTIARVFNGRYLNNVDTGTYTTKYVSANDYYTPYPLQQITVFNSFDQEAFVDVALVPKPGIKDLQISITAQTPARPGFDAGFRIITKNVGTVTIANAIVKLKKPVTVTYLNSTRTSSLVTADTITFSSINIAAGIIDTLDVNVMLAAPPAINNGDTLKFTAIAFPQATDTTPTNNVATLREITKGSFDPNDKTEGHAGVYTPTMKSSGEPFQYLIRFQNTGTDTAFYITVKDTIDSRVDVNSLETISCSHPYTFSMDGNVATWQFNMLKLVDSITNEAASHGYISFSIKPKDVLKIGDSILNKAAIYFDFNLPVVTAQNLLAYISDKSVLCPGGTTQLPAGQIGLAYQWQIDTGNGYTALAASAVYTGVTTSVLQIANAPSSLYGTQYRCLITLPGGSKTNGETYKLTFANTWTGATSNSWETAGNWSCGSMPDGNTDVMIKSTAIRQPQVNTITATCRSINANNASHVWIKAGAKLDVKGK